jgi:hypothetical protein
MSPLADAPFRRQLPRVFLELDRPALSGYSPALTV